MIQANGTVLACGEGSYGRLGQGNSDDLHVLTVISALQGKKENTFSVEFEYNPFFHFNEWLDVVLFSCSYLGIEMLVLGARYITQHSC